MNSFNIGNIKNKGISLWSSLKKTRIKFSGLFSQDLLNDNWYEDLEESLILADSGPRTARKLIDALKVEVSINKSVKNTEDARVIFEQLLFNIVNPLAPKHSELKKIEQINDTGKPFVIMIVGVNGSGKTTTIGKLANFYKSSNKSVMLAAGDTFRAAAGEQLKYWGEKNDIPTIFQKNGDPASIAFDAVKSSEAKEKNVLLIDTAGRLPSQLNLMDELKKIKRVIGKALPSAPNHTWLVVDGSSGQNTLSQVRLFHEKLVITGIIITKLDGTSKGGFILSLQDAKIPIQFIGVGEKIHDLKNFEPADLVASLIGK